MADDYIELSLKWTPNANVDVARRWLERSGLTVTTMKSGAILLATKERIGKVFSIAPQKIEPSANLPVPAELHDHVESITVSRPRSYHS